MPPYHSIYLMAVDWDQRAAAARAVYRAIRALGSTRVSHTDAYDHVKQANDGTPTLIGTTTSEGVLTLARQALDEAGSALTYAVDPTPEEVFTRQPRLSVVPDEPISQVQEDAGENEVFEPEVYETAMLLLVAQRGSPFAALTVAAGLARTTRSDSFTRVGKCLLHVFPTSDDSAAALVAEVLGDA